jgi:2-C-methyl-D-erythritol 4-phosphate cytidylyltransferase/2-C-methyl-D-erythritol 2,4-cyclodiphosphate synthase
MTGMRIGQGFDVHRFRAGRPLKLCGRIIPGEPGLDGHSDADVGLHAVTDAILGALARGDMGVHFPDSDPRWRDAESSVFISRAIEIAAAEGFALVNCDLTIIGERPRIAPLRESLRASLAECLGVPQSAVSVKATTTEGLGFLGRVEGLAAIAVVLLGEGAGHG